jgi:MFS family permease
MLLITGHCTTWTSLIICRSLTGLFANGGLLTAYAADIASSLADKTTLFSYFITAWAFARVAAAYIFPLVGEDVSVCCLCAFIVEVRLRRLGLSRHSLLVISCQSIQILAAVLASLPKSRSESFDRRDPDSMRLKARYILLNPLEFLRDRPSFRAAFVEMMRDRLVALLFITSLLMPRIDISAYLWQKFREGPSSVGYIKALESLTVIAIPLTPAIPIFTRRYL